MIVLKLLICLTLVSITFPELRELTLPQEVTIRGFIYQNGDGQWILASEPNLKSCCVGAKHKADTQIVLQGTLDFAKTDRVIAVRGVLLRHEDRFVMQNVQEIHSTLYFQIVLYLILGLLSIWLVRTCWTHFKRRKNS